MTPRELSLGGGRLLGWAEFGDPSGRPVLAFHGTPACRLLFAPADGPAARRGLRLIAPDRPGYGLSGPQPARTLRDWSTDMASLMDHLGLASAPILAISGGCPYAVASAAHLGDRVSGLALVSPLGEIGAPAARALLNRLERAFFLGVLRSTGLSRRTVSAGRAAFLAAPGLSYNTFAATLSTADKLVLAHPHARRIVIDMTREALRSGVGGATTDFTIFTAPWGVDLGAIRQPAVLWQGTADHLVPAALAFDLAKRLGNCRIVRLEGHGHFWIVEHAAEVLDEMASL